MATFLIFLAACSLRFPSVDGFRTTDWKPEFTEPQDVQITQATLGILTHCSMLFDPLQQTAPAIDAVVRQMKAKSLPVLYLHDKYNPTNPAWNYLYSDWKPTAYVASDVGHIDINLASVDHVICLGGFFEQCERSTVSDVVRMWQRDGFDHDLRITQVTDGVFSVLAYMNYSADRYERRARDFHRQRRSVHPKAIMTLAEVLDQIIDEELFAEFLQRQLSFMPAGINVVMDVYGVAYPVRVVGKESRTLTFAYRTSDSFLEFKSPEIDFERAARKPPSKRGSFSPVSRYPMASGRVIYSGSGVPVEFYSTPTNVYPPSSGTVYPSGTVFPGGTVLPNGSIPSNTFRGLSSGSSYPNK